MVSSFVGNTEPDVHHNGALTRKPSLGPQSQPDFLPYPSYSVVYLMQSEESWNWKGYWTLLEVLDWYLSLITYCISLSSLGFNDVILFSALIFFDSLVLPSGRPGYWNQRLELFAIGTAVGPICISTLYINLYLYLYLVSAYQDIFRIQALQLTSCVTSMNYIIALFFHLLITIDENGRCY